MQDLVTSVIRTAVPLAVGAVVSYLATKGLHAPDAVVAQATAFLTFAVGFVYYIVVRWLESKNPKLGVLLGKPTKPTYGD